MKQIAMTVEAATRELNRLVASATSLELMALYFRTHGRGTSKASRRVLAEECEEAAKAKREYAAHMTRQISLALGEEDDD